ncbi:MAG: hypothetical protein JW741_01470 [Sedimentisphaerales bacterium]|nr:hypothetical protein [Sedimentisphaerales bacterium]
MRTFKVLGCMAIVLFGAATAPAEDEVSVSVTSDLFSKYVWRGQNVTDDWVWQPGVSISYKGLTGGFWGNLDLTDENDESGQFIEYDYYVDYSGQINETVGFSVGGIYYYFPGGDATTELYWGFSFDVPASPAITVYHDIDEIDGTYAAFSVGHSFENPGDLPFGVDLGASLGWGDSSYNDGYWSTDTIEVDSELNDLTLTVGFPFEVGGLSVTPSLAYVALLGSDVRDVADDDSIFYAGVGLAYEF